MKINTRALQTGQLYFTAFIVAAVISLPILQVYADIHIPECVPVGKVCKDFDGEYKGFPRLTNSRINYCRKTKGKIELYCKTPEDKGCIASDCIPKSTLKGDQQCRSLFKDEENSSKQHSVYAFQESCSSTHERIVCCQKDTVESVLLAGYGAEAHEFPHQVQLLTSTKSDVAGSGEYGDSSCGGTIFNENYILTAAHCVVDTFPHPSYPYNRSEPGGQLQYAKAFDPDQIEVVVGTNIAMTAPDSNRYRVEEVIVHHKYAALKENQNIEIAKPNGNPRTLLNDIALLKIKGAIKFNEYTKALKVAPANFVPEVHADKVVIVGWGNTDNLATTEFLQKSDLKLRDESADNSCPVYQLAFDSAQHICIGGIINGEFGKIAGKGDSGGPAICRDAEGYGVQCGISSFAAGTSEACQKNPSEETCRPSVFAEVSYFLPWIINKTGGLGQDTGSTEFYQVPLYGINSDDDLGQVKIVDGNGKTCGGTLVSGNTVVTASHCAYDRNGKQKSLLVKYGSDEYSVDSFHRFTPPKKEGNNAIQADGMNVVNKDFFGNLSTTKFSGLTIEEPYYDSNVAVLKLANIVFGASPVSLATTPLTESEADVYEAAWMRNSKFMLRKFPSTVITNKNCQGRYDRFSQYKYTFPIGQVDACMVEKYSGGNACDREIGGGVFCGGPDERTLCGVQVFRMCDYSTPKIIADIYYYSNTIQEQIKANSV